MQPFPEILDAKMKWLNVLLFLKMTSTWTSIPSQTANEAGGEDMFRYFRLRTVTSFISFLSKLLEDENNKKC